MPNIRHIENRLTIVYLFTSGVITYRISYCSFKDQFSRKKGVQVALKSTPKSIGVNHKPDRSNNKIVASILLNEVMQNNQPRGFSSGMLIAAHNLGFNHE